MLKQVLHSEVTWRAFRWIHPDIATAIARRVSRTDPDAVDRIGRDLEPTPSSTGPESVSWMTRS